MSKIRHVGEHATNRLPDAPKATIGQGRRSDNATGGRARGRAVPVR